MDHSYRNYGSVSSIHIVSQEEEQSYCGRARQEAVLIPDIEPPKPKKSIRNMLKHFGSRLSLRHLSSKIFSQPTAVPAVVQGLRSRNVETCNTYSPHSGNMPVSLTDRAVAMRRSLMSLRSPVLGSKSHKRSLERGLEPQAPPAPPAREFEEYFAEEMSRTSSVTVGPPSRTDSSVSRPLWMPKSRRSSHESCQTAYREAASTDSPESFGESSEDVEDGASSSQDHHQDSQAIYDNSASPDTTERLEESEAAEGNVNDSSSQLDSQIADGQAASSDSTEMYEEGEVLEVTAYNSQADDQDSQIGYNQTASPDHSDHFEQSEVVEDPSPSNSQNDLSLADTSMSSQERERQEYRERMLNEGRSGCQGRLGHYSSMMVPESEASVADYSDDSEAPVFYEEGQDDYDQSQQVEDAPSQAGSGSAGDVSESEVSYIDYDSYVDHSSYVSDHGARPEEEMSGIENFLESQTSEEDQQEYAQADHSDPEQSQHNVSSEHFSSEDSRVSTETAARVPDPSEVPDGPFPVRMGHINPKHLPGGSSKQDLHPEVLDQGAQALPGYVPKDLAYYYQWHNFQGKTTDVTKFIYSLGSQVGEVARNLQEQSECWVFARRAMLAEIEKMELWELFDGRLWADDYKTEYAEPVQDGKSCQEA
ncbi:hypothetical protein BJ508DRAFT_301922 [Ascobolus immersus RN42]|uniref:Uncharacterized protein n=1 Tax=Ascobolus immersus RN42 TaxID=1160509 RepID=A0A3N4IL07_ASCIM|nr:hypothetical protein BJ508DRAFT_301922 [Ascobolus immersus RN42]